MSRRLCKPVSSDLVSQVRIQSLSESFFLPGSGRTGLAVDEPEDMGAREFEKNPAVERGGELRPTVQRNHMHMHMRSARSLSQEDVQRRLIVYSLDEQYHPKLAEQVAGHETQSGEYLTVFEVERMHE